jgi:peptidoglycan/xylan/chitin deacetylase (PgdA/CDA1 family)
MLSTHGRYRYSPITRRAGGRWPNGKRLALYVALGIEEYASGEGLSEVLLPGVAKPDLVNTAWRDYGNRVGGFRLIDRLGTFGIRPAILLNTEVYETAPDVVDAARRAGAEIIAHGRANSDTLVGMSPTTEARYVANVRDTIGEREKAPPRGWSTPWLAHTPTTLDALVSAGFRYILDLRLDDQPVWLDTSRGKLLSIPYALELNDSSTMIGRQTSASDFADMIVDEFDEMLDAAADQPLAMSIVIHSFISGQPFRLRALTRALQHIAAHRDDVWLALPGEIADAVAVQPLMAV